MTTWQEVFRTHVAPKLTPEYLRILRNALWSNDPRLIQGHTAEPLLHILERDLAHKVAATCACAIGFRRLCEGPASVAEVENSFNLFMADAGRPEVVPFLRWYDQTPREEVFPALAAEIGAILAESEAA
jgi:hypothetical protein